MTVPVLILVNPNDPEIGPRRYRSLPVKQLKVELATTLMGESFVEAPPARFVNVPPVRATWRVNRLAFWRKWPRNPPGFTVIVPTLVTVDVVSNERTPWSICISPEVA